MQFWICPDGASLMRCQRQRAIVAPSSGEKIFGSLDVVLLLSSAHRCRARELPRRHVTQCLACLGSPTGLCAYHARQMAMQMAAPPYVVPWWTATQLPLTHSLPQDSASPSYTESPTTAAERRSV